MPFGYRGKFLRVNLTERTVREETFPDVWYRRHLGGAGMIADLLLKEVPPGADPLGPDNKLIFAGSVISGLPFSGSGRNGVGAKSPLSGGLGKGEVGGFWGSELKKAGYDGVIVEGQSETPVYLAIRGGEAEIRDAAHLWGMETRESEAAIRRELGEPLARLAQIGPGGERLVRFAAVINDLRDAVGRTGMGAVMGSKRLKAIAVRGNEPVEVADPQRLKALAKQMASQAKVKARALHEFGTGADMDAFNLAGNLPVRNFRDGWFPDAGEISAIKIRDTMRVGMESCYACAVRCKKMVRLEGRYRVDPEYGGPEYETLASCGSNCGIADLEAIARAHHYCQANSLDTISAGAVVAFAMECFEAGLITTADTGGLELKWGDPEALLGCLELIVQRRGVGDALAEGTRRAAAQIGGGAERFAMEVKGVELGMHEPRLKHGLGLGYAVAVHGGDHCIGIHDTSYEKDGPALEAVKGIGVIEPLPADYLGPEKVRMFAYLHQWRNVLDSLTLCIFVPWSQPEVVDLVNATTGWNTTGFELMKGGERAITLGRCFNIREGLTLEEDRLPSRFFEPPRMGKLAGKAMDRVQWERARATYYEMMGWDRMTGVPTETRLAELGIEWAGKAMEVSKP